MGNDPVLGQGAKKRGASWRHASGRQGARQAALMASLLLLVMGGITVGQGVKLFALRKNAALLRSRIAAEPGPRGATPLEALEARLAELRAASGAPNDDMPEGAATLTMTGRAALIRDLLKKQGIVPARFRISGTGDEEAAEFTLRERPRPFLDFLSEADRLNAAAVVSLGIRMLPGAERTGGQQEAEITVRFGSGGNAAGNSAAHPDTDITPAALAHFFYHSGADRAAAPAVFPVSAASAWGEPVETTGAAVTDTVNLIFLGTIRDAAGMEYAYYKEKDSGLIIKKVTVPKTITKEGES
jgi:hypothetical protein